MPRLLHAVIFSIAALLLPANNVIASTIRVVSISPDVNDPLVVGKTATITVSLDYVLDSDVGMVSMRVQRTGIKNALLQHVNKTIRKGGGNISLNATITVPLTGTVQVLTELYDRDPVKPLASNLATYKVIKKKEIEQDEVWAQRLIGNWHEVKALGFGSDSQNIEFKSDGTYSVNGLRSKYGDAVTLLGYAGTWKIQDGKLQFSIASAFPSTEAHYSDEILWINDQEWAMVETDTGNVSRATRVKPTPAKTESP